MNRNRKFVAPLTKKMIHKLTELCGLNILQPAGENNFEFCLGQLYKHGVLHIKKQVENGVFIFFISISETGKELLNTAGLSMQPAY